MPKVSVIVPVYNVEKYLEKCLNSLVNQTLKDIEIIIVNDGTPDNSQTIIDKYQKKYPNIIKSYIKENGGLSDARNYGLKKASGKYVAFLDSDDYVTTDMYESMYKKAISGNFDMVVCDLNYIYGDKIVKAYSNIKDDTTNIKKTMLNIYPAAWNKIFKKALFNKNIEFKKGVWFEDVEFIYRLLPYVKKIGVVHEHFNQYVQRIGSITSTVNPKIYHYIDNWNGIIDFYKERELYQEYHHELEYCYVRYLLATFIKQASLYNYEDYQDAVKEAIINVKKHFPHYRKNKYFYQSIKGIYLLIFNKHIANTIYRVSKHKLLKKV